MKQIRVKSETIISRDVNVERYLKDIRKTKPLSGVEEKVLIKRAQSGDKKAANELTVANLKFVVSCAKEYQVPGVEIIDLISAGNFGLIDAIYKFNLDKEIKFISYAVWWIKNAIIEHLRENVKTIRLPYNQQNDITKYYREKGRLEKEFECILNVDQVAELSLTVNAETLRPALAGHQPVASFSDPLSSDDSEGTMEDLIEDGTSDFFDVYLKEHRNKAVRIAVEKLPTIQKRIMKLSFGLDDGIQRSNEDIADVIGLTAERVRQIKSQTVLSLQRSQDLRKCF